MGDDVRALFDRWVDAVSRGDWDTAGTMVHPDFIDEMPQTGERTRGWNNMRAAVEHYPGAGGASPGEMHEFHLISPDERFAMTPAYTLVKVEGSGDLHVATARVGYPDGSYWRMVVLARLKDGKLWRTTSYYAPELPAPEWRKEWVERMEAP